MKAEFWYQKWQKGDIGFHEGETNTFLKEHFDKLKLAKGSRVFLPLCGKTRDIAWLLARGYRIAGAELSELAIKDLFAELGLAATITQVGPFTKYSAADIDVFVGDIFELTAPWLGSVDAIYDRAALVALPETLRIQYAAQLLNITHTAPQLLITYEYNQQLIDGPPFSINEDEVKRHYAAAYHLQQLATQAVAGGLKGKVPSRETVWLLQ